MLFHMRTHWLQEGKHFAACGSIVASKTSRDPHEVTCGHCLKYVDRDALDPEVERIFNEFWAEIVCPNGVWNFAQIKKELYDCYVIMGGATAVYMDVTDGRISKPNTSPDAVIGEHAKLYAGRREYELALDLLKRLGVEFTGESHCQVGDGPEVELVYGQNDVLSEALDA